MKINSRNLAKRYAKAYVPLSQTAKQAEKRLEGYKKALADLKEAEFYLNSPVLPFSAKQEILTKALAEDNAARALISVLLRAKRFGLRELVGDEIAVLTRERKGLKLAEVTCAAPVDEAALSVSLAKYFKSGIEVDFKQDKSLLAGIIVKQGDIQIDASATGRIESLRQAITER
jgi:F-type H+-transporting ATPase subunit delta